MSYYYSQSSSPVSDFENSLFREVRSDCNSSSVYSHRSDESSSMNDFSPKSDSSPSEQPFSSGYGNFKSLTSPFQSSPEEANRSDLTIDNILNRSPLQLGELADLSNCLFSTEGKVFREILLHLQ